MSKRGFIRKVEDWLCLFTSRQFCGLTGRGTASIYGVLRAAGRHGGLGKIVMPAIIPPSIPNIVLAAGYEPVFCDVNLHDFNINVESLEETLETEKNVRGVIPVHLYGFPADMDRIVEVSIDRGLMVIEDFAQALGAEYKTKRCGSFGDASITSFGHTKILECGGGGAFLTDDEEFFNEICLETKKLPTYSEELRRKEQLYRQVYYMLKPIMDMDDELNMLYFEVPRIFRDIFLYRISGENAQRIHMDKENLENYIQKRRRNALLYRKLLCHPKISHPKYVDGGVYWRYCFLLNMDNVKEITEIVRSHGIDISNWYPPLHRWYSSSRKQDTRSFSNAVYVGNHIVNLWTLPSMTKERIEEISDIFLEVMDRFEKE